MTDPAHRETFAFLDRLRLEVRGDRRALAHFRAEYSRARADPGAEADLVVSFGRTPPGSRAFEAGYRSLRWRVALDPLGNAPLRATIDLSGAPRRFGLSLLQGYVVEPLLGLLAPAAEHVLLPSAAVMSEGGALLLLGRSRSGKSSLVARTAIAGTGVLGDDHVLVGAAGCRAFPRRLRLYPDVAETAPAARAALPATDTCATSRSRFRSDSHPRCGGAARPRPRGDARNGNSRPAPACAGRRSRTKRGAAARRRRALTRRARRCRERHPPRAASRPRPRWRTRAGASTSTTSWQKRSPSCERRSRRQWPWRASSCPPTCPRVSRSRRSRPSLAVGV